jgi:hypothetical protein
MPKIAGIVIAATLASLPCSGGYAGEPHPASLYISDEILDTVKCRCFSGPAVIVAAR